jgi:3'-phosphoadenosine 5'-phosphosulfate sulfotransferase (PAPS reductase)/FAD synthetase
MLQALPLEVKVRKTEERIKEWVDEYGIDGVYVSFSGGKDSTVLLHIARRLFPTIKAVFVDTGLEYPEIREFVRGLDNVDWLRPKMNFKQVIEKYGYPFFGKETSRFIGGAQRWKNKFIPTGKFIELQGNEEICSTLNCDAKIMLGRLEHKEKGVVIDGVYSEMYNKKKYKFAVDAPFLISNKCCDVMKKNPMKLYVETTKRNAITGQMASESKLRTKQWLLNGCNGFELKTPISNPMSFWTEQDVLYYVKNNNIPIASVYGEIVRDYDGTDIVDGQMDMSELDASLGIFDIGRHALKTTGCNRTGCMFCGYGCHLEKSPNRFERMKETHPKQYDYIMRPTEEGGLNYKEVIDWINEHGNMNIKY